MVRDLSTVLQRIYDSGVNVSLSLTSWVPGGGWTVRFGGSELSSAETMMQSENLDEIAAWLDKQMHERYGGYARKKKV